ncbi:MAG: AbrB/MazE/SpoVT family DNA-binding domain-containing protein [Nitrospirae bacterium]|nr:AbrB/MazE/SpoVT family DNA-binding domain-containing protein [Nitrospirota bacterium]MBI3352646.1 AbrB/MazE/SpoVT family DNA-binding domain-containing protein [Nitrospirota bacterium]
MKTTKLSSKGQVILPKSVRVAHHWEPGVKLAVEDREDGVLLRPVKPFKTTTLKEVMGCVGFKGPVKTLKDMEEAIAAEARAKK